MNAFSARYGCLLSVNWEGKGIPYGRITRNSGVNHGFMDLKGHPELVASVPELESDHALRALVIAIRQPDCGLFSVGCLSHDISDERGYKVTGYIEFAINSRESVQDASSYFPLFFHFSRHLEETGFLELARFNWELQPASYGKGIGGFSGTVVLNTARFPSTPEARTCWMNSLAALEECLGGFPIQPGEPIYPPA